MLNSTYWEIHTSGSEGRRWKQAYGSRTEHRSDSDGTRTGPYGHRATFWPYHSYFRVQNPGSVSVTLDQSTVRLRIGREPVFFVRHPERLGRRPVNSEALSRIDDNRAAPFYRPGLNRWSGRPLPAASRCAKMVLSDWSTI